MGSGKPGRLVRLVRLAGLFLVLPAMLGGEPFPLFFESAAPFRRAIAVAEREREGRAPVGEARITGVTVPHHLLAADMIATALGYAAGGDYERIVLLTPDHFRRSPAPGATTRRAFRTPLGPVPVDEEAALALCDRAGEEGVLVVESNLFSHEHGVQAVLPFLAYWFPGVPVLPVALHIHSGREDWERLVRRLEPWVTERTLVVQSTDFSHYLTQAEAARRDQETLRLLSAGRAEEITMLDQPGHVDSKAAQWIQMALQRRVAGVGKPVIVDNRNAIRYGGRLDEPSTTSYITQLYSPDVIAAAALPGEAWFLGGDTHFGRHMAEALRDAGRGERIRKAILAVSGGRPLVVNLEGVILEKAPTGYAHPMRIGMGAELALGELRALGVTAVSLANNHTLDYGRAARERMVELLREAGIAVADEGAPVDLGPFRLGVATDVVNRPQPAREILTEPSFAPWREAGGGAKPLFALLHCGEEYAGQAGRRERQLAAWAEEAGAELILGAHPHRPSLGWEWSEGSLRFYSLGNLIFDQRDPANGGGLVEVRFFEQGTWAARWHPLGNLYARALGGGG